MLISKYATDITINSSNYKHFKERGYDVTEGVLYNVPLEDVMKNSHIDVSVECDRCHTNKIMMFKTYNSYKGEYLCRKCAEERRKKTLKKNYNVEYPAQNEKISMKIQDTVLERYGYDNVAKIPEIKNIKNNHQKKKKSH